MQQKLTRKTRLIVIAIMAVVAVVFLAQYIALAIIKTNNTNLQNELSNITETNTQLEKDIESLNNEEEQIEYARQQYGYTYPDEQKFVGE